MTGYHQADHDTREQQHKSNNTFSIIILPCGAARSVCLRGRRCRRTVGCASELRTRVYISFSRIALAFRGFRQIHRGSIFCWQFIDLLRGRLLSRRRRYRNESANPGRERYPAPRTVCFFPDGVARPARRLTGGSEYFRVNRRSGWAPTAVRRYHRGGEW